MESKTVLMDDLVLQEKCIKAGRRYMEAMHPSLHDLEKSALIRNAAQAGFSMGYRAREEEEQAEADRNTRDAEKCL